MLPADAIDGVGPGIADRYTVSVRNAGNVNITLAIPTSTTIGALFRGANPATVSFSDYTEPGNDGILLPGEQANVDVIVTGSTSWAGTQYQGATGTVTVQIQGQS